MFWSFFISTTCVCARVLFVMITIRKGDGNKWIHWSIMIMFQVWSISTFRIVNFSMKDQIRKWNRFRIEQQRLSVRLRVNLVHWFIIPPRAEPFHHDLSSLRYRLMRADRDYSFSLNNAGIFLLDEEKLHARLFLFIWLNHLAFAFSPYANFLVRSEQKWFYDFLKARR